MANSGPKSPGAEFCTRFPSWPPVRALLHDRGGGGFRSAVCFSTPTHSVSLHPGQGWSWNTYKRPNDVARCAPLLPLPSQPARHLPGACILEDRPHGQASRCRSPHLWRLPMAARPAVMETPTHAPSRWDGLRLAGEEGGFRAGHFKFAMPCGI